MENAVNVDSWAVHDQGRSWRPILPQPLPWGRGSAAPPARPSPLKPGGWRGWRCESLNVCPDLDVGNFQHENDSTAEISSFHLKLESERPGPSLCELVGVGWGEGRVES